MVNLCTTLMDELVVTLFCLLVVSSMPGSFLSLSASLLA